MMLLSDYLRMKSSDMSVRVRLHQQPDREQELGAHPPF